MKYTLLAGVVLVTAPQGFSLRLSENLAKPVYELASAAYRVSG